MKPIITPAEVNICCDWSLIKRIIKATWSSAAADPYRDISGWSFVSCLNGPSGRLACCLVIISTRVSQFRKTQVAWCVHSSGNYADSDSCGFSLDSYNIHVHVLRVASFEVQICIYKSTLYTYMRPPAFSRAALSCDWIKKSKSVAKRRWPGPYVLPSSSGVKLANYEVTQHHRTPQLMELTCQWCGLGNVWTRVVVQQRFRQLIFVTSLDSSGRRAVVSIRSWTTVWNLRSWTTCE